MIDLHLFFYVIGTGFACWWLYDMKSSKKREIQKFYVKDLGEYILERNRKKYMEDCQKEPLVSFHCRKEHAEITW